ncbi:MAG: hypothetical protein HXO06_09180 [Prevotella salivae]|uniref:hypothetical protein n=1 Tax=Segatella salivae TaxID=228604 RepID=UPI001CABC62B|nr:hypothetical protein [Segatella salivae]MBF1545345.1 hypothetical protein [Segatella salivae]
MKSLTDHHHSLVIVRDNKGNGSTLHDYFNLEGKQYRIVLDRRSVQPLMALKVQLKTIGNSFVIR